MSVDLQGIPIYQTIVL